MKVNIISRSNGVGLDRDVEIIKTALEQDGHEVITSHYKAIFSWIKGLLGMERSDLNIFLERIYPWWCPTATKNSIVPNQERFPKRDLNLLKKMDLVLCKTLHALEIFSQHHQSSRFISFTSEDRQQLEPSKEPTFFHLAGKSTLKGTDVLLQLWKENPQWPELTLVQHPSNTPEHVPKNVNLIDQYLSDEDLKTLQNKHLYHLCPSLSEGWGHYIAEAASCGVTVITTDAPPMNELISNERGHLISSNHQEPRHLGINFYVDPVTLESKINEILAANDETHHDRGKKARQWYEENHNNFEQLIQNAIRTL